LRESAGDPTNSGLNRLLPGFIRRRLVGRGGLQQVLENTGWLFGDKILRMGVGLWVNIWVVRYLGPSAFGQLSYATAFVALFGVLATLGLDGIMVRELVRKPADAPELLGSALFLRILGGCATLLASVVAISRLHPGDPKQSLLVGIIAAGTIFQAFDVIDFWFRSQVLSRYTVVAKNCAFLACAVLKITLVMQRASLAAFAWVVIVEMALGAAGLVLSYQRSGHSFGRLRVSVRRCTALLSDSWPMMLSGLSVAVYMKIDQVMLGEMVGDQAVGIYSSVTRLTEIWYIIPSVLVSSVFPAIVQSKEKDEALYFRRVTRLFSVMAAVSLPIALPMSLGSDWLVGTLYGPSFQAAGPVLAVHIWASLFVFYAVAQSPWDLTENLTRLAMLRMVGGALANIALNLVLIPRYGALGAAIATVVSQALAAVLLNALHPKTRRILVCQLQSLLFWRYLRGL
jgi:PST family polysaccharide transporter